MEHRSYLEIAIEFETWKDGVKQSVVTDWCPLRKYAATSEQIEELANYWWDKLVESWKPHEIKFVKLHVKCVILRYFDFDKWKPKE